MKNLTAFLVAVLALPSLLSAQTEPPAAAAAHALATAERCALSAGVAEYTFKVRVGNGPYDEIGIHRVVKETAPNAPAHSATALFLAPGDIWNFRAAFLTGNHPLPQFLAENGVDVWGIDYRWTFVPASVTDTSFMQSWGIEQDASDLRYAINVARFGRAMTGSGFDKLFLLGWSRGGQIGYAALNAETQLPPGQRSVRAFVPVDIYLKTNDPQLKAAACQRQQATEATLAAGGYGNPIGGLVAVLGQLAALDPNGSSILNGPPFNLPGYTNREAGLLVGEATFALLGGLEPAPFYHFTGGVFGTDGKPAGLLYSSEADLFTFEQGAAPFQPNRELADADTATCEANNVPWDDHLGEITVPVYYIGAGGGFGETGLYTTTLLGSTDVTANIVHQVPSTQRILDFGHADLFLASDAQQLVWEPLLGWLQTH